MCSVCLTHPCHPFCPNAPEPQSIGFCQDCGEEIFEGSEYAEINGDLYHKDCLDVMSTENLLKLFGVELQEA